jgi:hypothetical protein
MIERDRLQPDSQLVEVNSCELIIGAWRLFWRQADDEEHAVSAT